MLLPIVFLYIFDVVENITMRKTLLILSILCVFLSCTGCGQTGALHLPEPQNKTAT